MRRRSKRGPNTSESTGKIGQEIPANQPKPLRPSYPDEAPEAQPTAHDVSGDDAGDVGLEPHVFGEPSGQLADSTGSSTASQAAASEHIADLPVAAEPGQNLVVETQPETLSTPPEPLAAASKRGPVGYVVLAIGLPGSGKTTWFKRRGVTPLSSDMLRDILFDDIEEQRFQGLVFSTLRSLLRARLIAKMPWNYVDATNLSPHERRQWIKMSKTFKYDVQAVYFDVPFEVCMERNNRRERVVSEESMRRMADRLRPPSFKEGFSKITLVRVKGSGPSTTASEAAPGEV